VYVGPASNTLAYFEALGYRKPVLGNPADFFVDIIAGRVEPSQMTGSKPNGEKVNRAQDDVLDGSPGNETGTGVDTALAPPTQTADSTQAPPHTNAKAALEHDYEPSVTSWLGAGTYNPQAAAAHVNRLVEQWRQYMQDGGLANQLHHGTTALEVPSPRSANGKTQTHAEDAANIPTQSSDSDQASDQKQHQEQHPPHDQRQRPEASMRYSEMDQGQIQELAVIFDRAVPGFWTQLWLELKRCAIIDLRAPSVWVIDCVLWIIAALGLGVASLNGTEYFIPPLPYELAVLCPSIIRERCLNQAIQDQPIYRLGFFVTMVNGAIACVWASRTFGLNKSVFFRDRERGMSVSAYWLARWLYDVLHVLRASLIYLAFWLPMAMQRGTFGDHLGIIFPLQFAAYGLGYLVSVLMRYERASIVSIVIAIGLAVTCGLVPPLDVVLTWGPMAAIWFISYNFWSGQAIAILSSSNQGVERVDHILREAGYYPDLFALSCAMGIIIGLVYRLLTLLALKRVHRPKHGAA